MGKSINVQNSRFAKVHVTQNADGTRTFSFDKPELVSGTMKLDRVPTVAKGTLYEDGKLTENLSKRTGYNLALDFGRIPQKWRDWLEGTSTVAGVSSDKGDCVPNAFAFGCEIDHVQNSVVTKEMIWFIYCTASPIEDSDKQATTDLEISNDTLSFTAFKLSEFENRAYVKIDTSDSSVTADMIANFFTQVQTSDTIAAPVAA